MRYLCLLYVNEDTLPGPGTPEFAEVAQANIAATKEMSAAGILVDSAPLHRTRSATTLRIVDDETVLTDGPYAELKEQLGGYYLLECANLDEALAWAQRIPAAKIGAVEIRPLLEMGTRN
jgi:hypothetical protein